MKEDDADYEGLAEAWVQNDPRLSALDPERAKALAARLAEALDKRRREVAGELVVHVHRTRLDPEKGLDPEALDRLAELVEEAAAQEEEPPE